MLLLLLLLGFCAEEKRESRYRLCYKDAVGSLVEQLAKLAGVSVEEFQAKIESNNSSERIAEKRSAEQEAATVHAKQAPLYPEAEVILMDEARALLESVPTPSNPKVEGVFDLDLWIAGRANRSRST